MGSLVASLSILSHAPSEALPRQPRAQRARRQDVAQGLGGAAEARGRPHRRRPAGATSLLIATAFSSFSQNEKKLIARLQELAALRPQSVEWCMRLSFARC